ncbi:unnamed protein product, partial [Prorocentrum cordatum]
GQYRVGVASRCWRSRGRPERCVHVQGVRGGRAEAPDALLAAVRPAAALPAAGPAGRHPSREARALRHPESSAAGLDHQRRRAARDRPGRAECGPGVRPEARAVVRTAAVAVRHAAALRGRSRGAAGAAGAAGG